MAKTYRDIEKGQIVIQGTELAINPDEPAKTVWNWKRLISEGPHEGVQVDGSGPLRNSVDDVEKLARDLAKRFPNDEIVGAPQKDG